MIDPSGHVVHYDPGDPPGDDYYPGDPPEDDFDTLARERDELRAKVERLKKIQGNQARIIEGERQQIVDYDAEVERLNRAYEQALAASIGAEQERERLEEQANRMAGTLTACTLEIERLRARIVHLESKRQLLCQCPSYEPTGEYIHDKHCLAA